MLSHAGGFTILVKCMLRCIEDAVSVGMLREKFDYDSETGVLTHKPRAGITPGDKMFNTRYAGKSVGHPNTSGHLQVGVTGQDGRYYLVLVHRINWALHTGAWPTSDLDHRDTDKSNNQFLNLRPCDGSGNRMNTTVRSDNTTGFKGVTRASRGSPKYQAQLMDRGKRVYLGQFDDAKTAAHAYDAAANEHFGEFARTNAAMGLL